jgi:hypothetical protein
MPMPHVPEAPRRELLTDPGDVVGDVEDEALLLAAGHPPGKPRPIICWLDVGAERRPRYDARTGGRDPTVGTAA